MKIILIIIMMMAILLIPSLSIAEWSKTDTAFQITYTALHVMDWGQTRYAAKNPQKFHENNPILGEYPSVGEVDTYMALSLVGHTAVSYLLPEKANMFGLNIRPRRLWQGMTIGFTGGLIIHNFNIGMKVKF